MQTGDRYLAIRNVTLIGVVINITVTVAELVFGWLGNSQALIADGMHAFSDLVSDGVVLVAAKYTAQDADDEHPYGHGRFETVATVLVAAILLIVALFILIDASWRLFHPDALLHPSGLSLLIAALTILAKEGLYRYTIHVAEQVRSQMLRANAWHSRSDALSSIIVVIGIAGTMFGLLWADALAAIIVSFMIAHIGWSLGTGGLRELVDTGLETTKVEEIRQLIENIEGVKTLHELRTRQMGANALVDVHILVDPYISVSEGHQISETVRTRLINAVEEVAEVMVHIDPEDDQQHRTNLNLPSRGQISALIQQSWDTLDTRQTIERIVLHYLDGKLVIEVYLPLQVIIEGQAVQELSQHFSTFVDSQPDIQSIKVYFQ
ncbi:MAG: cation transporter [Beggiatoa sp. IS2]|nr:MAG: cation transporter [Beggiatoa sp. IS2]